MTASHFCTIGFDKKTTDNWHFYGADICYQNLLSGNSNYILPLEICHESLGNQFNSSFRRATTKIISKCKKKIDWLYTTRIAIPCTHTSHIKWIILTRLKLFVYRNH